MDKGKGRPVKPSIAGSKPDPARIVAHLLSEARKREDKERSDG